MKSIKMDENTYQIVLYDWVERHDDYTVGLARRYPNADEFDDRSYWLFYPHGYTEPMNSKDLRDIGYFIAELNTQGDSNEK